MGQVRSKMKKSSNCRYSPLKTGEGTEDIDIEISDTDNIKDVKMDKNPPKPCTYLWFLGRVS